MKIIVLRSVPPPQECGPRPEAGGEYTVRMDTRYADRFIGHLADRTGFCTACGPECNACRAPFSRRFGEDIAAVVDFPAVLPHMLEEPSAYLPPDPPPHDVIVAIAIHEQILVEVVRRCPAWGTRGIVVPIEAPGRISRAARAKAEQIASAAGVEISFPKPFCAFDPPPGGALAEFRGHFRVGKPEVDITVADGRITAAEVKVSAPCGATHHVARWLVGRAAADALKCDVVGRRLQSYPCTASMEWDDEIDDTIMHLALYAHSAMLDPISGQPSDRKNDEPSPAADFRPPAAAGRPAFMQAAAMAGAPPVWENRRRIDSAREAILAGVARGGSVSLEELRGPRGLTPAAVSTALLLLRQEGRVAFDGRSIRSSHPRGGEI
jgi:thymidylate synthase